MNPIIKPGVVMGIACMALGWGCSPRSDGNGGPMACEASWECGPGILCVDGYCADSRAPTQPPGAPGTPGMSPQTPGVDAPPNGEPQTPGATPGDGSTPEGSSGVDPVNRGVVMGSLVAKSGGETLGYVVSMTERTVTIFDPDRDVIFAVNDQTGYLVGRYTYDEPESEFRYYENSQCSGRSVRQISDLYNGSYSLGSGTVGQCDPNAYPEGRRIQVFAEGGDFYGLSQGTRAVYVGGIAFQIRAQGDGADYCAEVSSLCALEHSATDRVPLAFSTPITIEERDSD